jgi:hypothetical protein
MKRVKRPIRAIFLASAAVIALAAGAVIGVTIISAVASFSAEAFLIGPDA